MPVRCCGHNYHRILLGIPLKNEAVPISLEFEPRQVRLSTSHKAKNLVETQVFATLASMRSSWPHVKSFQFRGIHRGLSWYVQL